MREEERIAITRAISLRFKQQYKISYLKTLTNKELIGLYDSLFSK